MEYRVTVCVPAVQGGVVAEQTAFVNVRTATLAICVSSSAQEALNHLVTTKGRATT